MMYCPGCGTHADSNFCPNCGKDLRKILINKSTNIACEQQSIDYSKYMQYYPNNFAAIKKLRSDTGIGIAEATHIIDDLFATKGSTIKANISYKMPEITKNDELSKGKTKKVVKRAEIAASVGLFTGLKVIFDIAKKYK